MSGWSESIRLFDDGRELTIAGKVREGRILSGPDALKESLGWELKPEGLCKDEICVPVRDRGALVPDTEGGGGDLAAFASAVGRPLAIDADSGVAALGVAASDRARDVAALEAPDFELPDLCRQVHRLSDHRGNEGAPDRLRILVRLPRGPAGLAGDVRRARLRGLRPDHGRPRSMRG